jgi:PAS domain S-box-containing protein
MSTTIIDVDSHGRKRYIILFTTAALLVLGALWGAKQAGHEKDTRMRRELVRQAVAVAAAVPIDEASALSFTIDDLARPEYTRLCAMFKAWSDLTGLESIYTMKLRDDGRFVFGPESLEPDSPGDVYQQPTEQDFLPFQTGEPVVVGPFTDEYGTFVSALAPVIQPRTGEVLFTVGIDIEAAEWKSEIRRVQWIPLLTVLLPLAVLFIGGVLIKRRSRTSPESTHLRHHTEATVCAIISLVLTLIATLFVSREERILRRDAFYSAAQFKAKGHAEYFRSTSETLGMLAVFFESSEEITAEEFRTVCAPILRRHAIEGCIWCPEVAAEEQSAFETGMSAAGYTGFSIRPLPDTDGNAPTEKLYPALYVEPAEIAEEARGYNLASEPVRRAALLEARETGQITATDPIRLAALPDRPQGIFLFCPVNAVTQKGVLALVFRPEKNMQSLARQARSETVGMKTCLLQMQSGGPPQTLYCPVGQTVADCANEVPGELRATFPVFVFGKPYALLITPDKQWLAANPLRHTRMTLVAGLILSGLFTALIAVLANRPRLLERQVLQRTAELRKSEERFEIAADAGGIGIWDRNIEKNQLFWDDRMYTIYGVRKKDFGGAYEAWQQCVHPDDLERTAAEVIAAEKGEKPFDTKFRIVRPDGETRHIRAFGNVIRDRSGVPVRMLGTNQDISQYVLAEQKLKQSEAKLRGIVENSTNMFYSHTPEHVLTYVSPQVKDILGYEVDEALVRWTDLASDHPENERGFKLTEEAVRSGKAQPTYECQLIHKDGHPVWVEVREAPVVEDGRTVSIVGSLNDITERKRMEEALEKRIVSLTRPLDSVDKIEVDELFSLPELQKIQDEFSAATGVASIITRPDGTPITQPSNFTDLCRKIIRGTEKGCANCYKSDAALGHVHPSGPIIQLCLSGGLWDAGANISVGGKHIASWLIGQVRDETQTEEQMLAYAREIGADEDAFLAAFHKVPIMSKEQFAAVAQALFTMANQLSTSAYQNVQQARFISDQKKAENELRRLSTAIEQFPETVIITDTKGTIQYVNPAFETISGYTRDEAVGRTPGILKSGKHSNSFYNEMWNTLNAGKIWSGRIVNKRKNGSLYKEDVSIAPVKDKSGTITHFVGVKRDITAELVRDEQMQQAQKMEAVGQLAGGIAHDFNNILQAILGFSELLLPAVEHMEYQHRDALEIQKAARHAADLTRQLLAFSRKQPVQMAVMDLNDAITGTQKILSSVIGENVQIITELDPALDLIQGDEQQIRRVIVNLAINARDAMPDGGHLTLRTEKVSFSAEEAAVFPDARAGEFACLTVNDTGTGMSEQIMPHIFEPFFSTKAPGKGTGLGLAAIYGIVQEHKGWINVNSELGEGSTFNIYFPICRDGRSIDHEKARIQTETLLLGNGERILVVDDDPAILALSKKALTRSGYTVKTATSAEEALQIFEEENGAFDLLFSDVILPQKNGADLAASLKAKYPELPILLCSGYSGDRVHDAGIEQSGFFFLEKPFSIFSLLKLVHTVFSSR